MNASIEVVETKLFSGAIADEISSCLAEAIAERGVASIALAGGGTPGATYRLLALPPRVGEIEWSKVRLFWGDERWVTREDTQSNYRLVRETLLDSMPAPGPQVYPVTTTGISPEAAAADYAKIMREVLGTPPDQVPVLDIALLGVGIDGDTASIFPGSALLKNTSDVCSVVRMPDGTPRITLTPSVLLAARRIILMVRGPGKADIVKQVLEGGLPSEIIPARFLDQAGDRVTWFLDSAAARKLSSERLLGQGGVPR